MMMNRTCAEFSGWSDVIVGVTKIAPFIANQQPERGGSYNIKTERLRQRDIEFGNLIFVRNINSKFSEFKYFQCFYLCIHFEYWIKMGDDGGAKEVEGDKKIVHTYPLVKVTYTKLSCCFSRHCLINWFDGVAKVWLSFVFESLLYNNIYLILSILIWWMKWEPNVSNSV